MLQIYNQYGGEKNKLLFIMFPGNGVIKNGWDTIDFNYKNGAIKRNNFIKEIKKLGEIYFYEPKYYNRSILPHIIKHILKVDNYYFIFCCLIHKKLI